MGVFDNVRPGHTVHYLTPQGSKGSGRVVLAYPTHVVLKVPGRNMPHVVTDRGFVMAKDKNKVISTGNSVFADAAVTGNSRHFNKEETNTRPYIVWHPKKGTKEIHATTSYGAAKAAADMWKLKNTASVHATLADVTHVATESVNEIAVDSFSKFKTHAKDWAHTNTPDGKIHLIPGKILSAKIGGETRHITKSYGFLGGGTGRQILLGVFHHHSLASEYGKGEHKPYYAASDSEHDTMPYSHLDRASTKNNGLGEDRRDAEASKQRVAKTKKKRKIIEDKSSESDTNKALAKSLSSKSKQTPSYMEYNDRQLSTAAKAYLNKKKPVVGEDRESEFSANKSLSNTQNKKQSSDYFSYNNSKTSQPPSKVKKITKEAVEKLIISKKKKSLVDTKPTLELPRKEGSPGAASHLENNQ